MFAAAVVVGIKVQKIDEDLGIFEKILNEDATLILELDIFLM